MPRTGRPGTEVEPRGARSDHVGPRPSSPHGATADGRGIIGGSPTAESAALAAVVEAIHRWAALAGVPPGKVLGPLAAEIVEQRVCALLTLQRARNPVQAGWDATEPDGTTYQIKARSLSARQTSFDFRPEPHDFDVAVFAIYDPADLSLIEVWTMPRDDVLRDALVFRGRRSLRWPGDHPGATLRYRRPERSHDAVHLR